MKAFFKYANLLHFMSVAFLLSSCSGEMRSSDSSSGRIKAADEGINGDDEDSGNNGTNNDDDSNNGSYGSYGSNGTNGSNESNGNNGSNGSNGDSVNTRSSSSNNLPSLSSTEIADIQTSIDAFKGVLRTLNILDSNLTKHNKGYAKWYADWASKEIIPYAEWVDEMLNERNPTAAQKRKLNALWSILDQANTVADALYKRCNSLP